MKAFNMIIIDGKRWFQKSYGNTYHSVLVTVDGVYLGDSGKHYGYGDTYQQTAFTMLQNKGYFEGIEYNEFCQLQRVNNLAIYAFIAERKQAIIHLVAHPGPTSNAAPQKKLGVIRMG